ncbi:6-carboxytetrahydropterin synthase QueD [Hyphococcus luteus]|uniref:6-carboxy-5,6,7,8-tetrahydropterin synthase n=1 Tax=Hyphococcus luteus TaxID=2058213 RepID=A0A2S7K9Y9_9PROT|nr:6-carboxytetrahydropterin synthase QueD [Marinicaulis flavus]PQA89326.1 6-carboxytetrahydropterin synthase QueD [Marinicaulis flavus]
MRIVKSMSFDAAHFLDHDPEARPYARLHGHSFKMEVVIDGEPQEETGWVVDFGDVAEALQDLHDALDHRLLNEVEGLERPTLENICQWAAKKLKARFPGLAEVRVSRPSNGETCIYTV